MFVIDLCNIILATSEWFYHLHKFFNEIESSETSNTCISQHDKIRHYALKSILSNEQKQKKRSKLFIFIVDKLFVYSLTFSADPPHHIV